jgi:TonB family protein
VCKLTWRAAIADFVNRGPTFATSALLLSASPSKMAFATTSEFVRAKSRTDVPPFSMIEQKGLIASLGEELARATRDFTHDPRGFIRDLFSGETKDAKRRRRIYIGLAIALVAHLALIAGVVVASLMQPAKPKPIINWVGPGEFTPNKTPDISKPEMPKGNGGGSSGGGGEQGTHAPVKGVLPAMSPAAPVVKLTAPSKSAPVLPVFPTIPGPENTPPPTAQLGLPTSNLEAPPAPTSGSRDGYGGKDGPGVGPGSGPGTGPGDSRGPGGKKGTAGSPDGTGSPSGEIPFNAIRKPEGFKPFTWVYRPTPIVTPEAQANKVAGTVLLRATFRADGKITDIEVVNPVNFMTESAIDSLSRSRFSPATVNGVPVTLTRVPVYIKVHY